MDKSLTPVLPVANDITISATTMYLPEQSQPQEQRYAFCYTITITNNGERAVRLLARNWLITDANGETSVVEGEGVIGKTPDISPSSSFTYTSGSIFKTPVGTMQGYYRLQNQDGDLLKADIPVFRLAIPNILN